MMSAENEYTDKWKGNPTNQTAASGHGRIWIYIIIAAAGCFLALVCAVLGIFLGKWIEQQKKPVFNGRVIQQKISMCSELTTSTLDYHGAVYFEDGGIPWITQKTFTMGYDAHVEAGIDLSKTQVEVEDNVIYVTLPDVEVQDIVIDPNSLTFDDESFALLNWKKHEDVAEALQYAYEDAYTHVNETQLKEKARTQAEDVIRTLLTPIIEDENNTYEIVIQ